MTSFSKVSVALIAICALVTLTSGFGASMEVLNPLFIASINSEGLQEIFGGQVWRLVTPIFIHFGIMHFAFNMLWVWDLGRLIEYKKGMGFYIGFVLLVGIFSNLAQYVMTQAPNFGGMSGVVYGMFGYIWIMGRLDPRFGVAMSQQTVVMMLVWFVLCWTGLLGSIANWAHTGGLLAGMAWAYASSMGKMLRR